MLLVTKGEACPLLVSFSALVRLFNMNHLTAFTNLSSALEVWPGPNMQPSYSHNTLASSADPVFLLEMKSTRKGT